MVQMDELLQRNCKCQRRTRLQDVPYMALCVLPSKSDHCQSDLLSRLVCNLYAMEADVEYTQRQPNSWSKMEEVVRYKNCAMRCR